MEPARARPTASLVELRRRLTGLVYREASRTAGVGLALVVLPLVYVLREWPPWAIRDALLALPPFERGAWLAAAHVGYGLATAPLVRQLLASERLRWWWTLPLPAGFWRRLHLRHLLLLDAPWLLAIGYGVAPRLAAEPWSAVAIAIGFGSMTLAGQVAMVAVVGRPAGASLLVLLAWAGAVMLGVGLPAPVALGLGGVALAACLVRLGRPLPESRAARRGLAGGPPVVALARLHWLAVRRHTTVPIVMAAVAQLLALGLLALARAHAGEIDPAAVDSLRRGLAVLCASIGATLVLLAARRLDGDRPWLDSLGIDPGHERRGRGLLGAAGALPAALVGAVLLPAVGEHVVVWPLELALCAAWAAVDTTTLTFTLEARRRLHQPRLPRQLLRIALAAGVVVAAGTVLALLPWLAVAARRLPAAQRDALRARLRFESSRRDDHQA